MLVTTTPGRRGVIVGGRSARQGDQQELVHHQAGAGSSEGGTHVRVWNGTNRPPPRRSGRLHRPLMALVALAAVGVLAAGCGSNGSGSSSGGMGGYGSSGTAPASGGASSVATVSATSTSLGMILVDGSGRTLYLFEKDQPNQSACSGACVAAWPVDQSSGTPKAGSGVKASLLGTIRRGDGTTQVYTPRHYPV